MSFPASVLAVTTVWDGGSTIGNTNWGSGPNWVGNIAPGPTNDVEFGVAFTSGTNIQTVGNRTVNSLIINTLTPFSISGAPTDVITVTTGTLTRDDPDGEEGDHTINTGIALGANAIWSVWGSGTLAISGPITQIGAGRSLTKYGWGLLLLTNGSGNYSGGTFIEESTLQMNGVWNGTGAINVALGAGLDVSAADISNPINLRGDGFENWGALRALSASTIGGPVTLLANSTITAKAEVLTINGVISDGTNSFGLTKYGAGELRLNAANTYKGGTTINEGTLSVASDSSLGSGAVTIAAGKLLYTANTSTTRDFTITNGRLQANTGLNVILSGSEIQGGFIAGPGAFSTNNGASFMGTTTLAGSNLQPTGPTSLVNFINGGNIISTAPLSWDGGMNLSSGTVILNAATLSTTAFSNDGVININNDAALTNTGNTLVSGGGSRITIAIGGSLNVATALHLNGALFVNNGTITGTTNVNYGSLAKGAGVYGAVNVTDGGRFSPGNSPGSATTGSTTWNSGGSYIVEIADALAGAGIGWDAWNINGSLNLNTAPTTNGRFTISLSTMDALAANFDPRSDYDWIILHTTDGISNFDPAAISLDTSAFKNNLFGGHFSIISTQNDLAVHFSAVPEPSLALGILGILALCSRPRTRLQQRERI
jgi:autotransporter-associated beta strand protein